MTVSEQHDYDVLVQASNPNPIISVVVALFNMERNGFLAECLKSFECQEASDVEYIICDDASTDRSLEKALSFARARDDVSVVHLRENKKMGAARNRGIAIARGSYVAIVDSDDEIAPGYINSIIHAIKDIGADCIFPEMIQYIDASGRSIGEPVANIVDADCLGKTDVARRKKLLLHHGRFAAIRRSFLSDEKNLFLEGMFYEDTPTGVRWWLLVESAAVARGSVYRYRVHSESTVRTTGIDERKLADRLKSADMIIDNAIDLSAYDEFRDEVDEYFMKVYLLNTFGMIGGRIRPSDAIELRNHAISRVPDYLENPYYKGKGGKQRLRAWLFVKHPVAATAILHARDGLKSLSSRKRLTR